MPRASIQACRLTSIGHTAPVSKLSCGSVVAGGTVAFHSWSGRERTSHEKHSPVAASCATIISWQSAVLWN